jgi:crossover junction endodeoxyribonuclease RusA
MLMFEFPMPPSANRIWRVARNRVHKSAEYREWLDESAVLVKRQGVPTEPIGYPVSVEIVVGRPDRRKRDLDNRLKPALDLMQHARILADDSLVHRINAAWCSETVGMRVYLMPIGEA